MSGTLKVVPADTPFDRHTHMRLELSGGDELRFRDPRMFGLIALRNGSEINTFPEFAHYGPEPLSPEFNAEYFSRVLKNRTAKIGIILMDQRVVTGLGKIYADEVLFCAGLRPTRAAGKLTKKEIAKLVACTKKVLEKAIGDRGTSASDGSYVDAYGLQGGFRPAAYQRTGQPCVKCRQPIRRTRLTGGRGLHWCPKCQK
jgi:formamidopyrimidine-DNA glycosylase